MSIPLLTVNSVGPTKRRFLDTSLRELDFLHVTVRNKDANLIGSRGGVPLAVVGSSMKLGGVDTTATPEEYNLQVKAEQYVGSQMITHIRVRNAKI